MATATYRALLRLFLPASFRGEFGEEMTAIFAERHAAQQGLPGRVLLWLATVVDLTATAVREHGDILRRDLRVAGRGFLRSPSFPVLAVATLALGIGANTAVYSVVDHVLVRPLPFPDPDPWPIPWPPHIPACCMSLS